MVISAAKVTLNWYFLAVNSLGLAVRICNSYPEYKGLFSKHKEFGYIRRAIDE